MHSFFHIQPLLIANLFGNFRFGTGYFEMRCSKAFFLSILDLVDLFDNEVIEQVECKDIIERYRLHSAAFKSFLL